MTATMDTSIGSTSHTLIDNCVGLLTTSAALISRGDPQLALLALTQASSLVRVDDTLPNRYRIKAALGALGLTQLPV